MRSPKALTVAMVLGACAAPRPQAPDPKMPGPPPPQIEVDRRCENDVHARRCALAGNPVEGSVEVVDLYRLRVNLKLGQSISGCGVVNLVTQLSSENEPARTFTSRVECPEKCMPRGAGGGTCSYPPMHGFELELELNPPLPDGEHSLHVTSDNGDLKPVDLTVRTTYAAPAPPRSLQEPIPMGLATSGPSTVAPPTPTPRPRSPPSGPVMEWGQTTSSGVDVEVLRAGRGDVWHGVGASTNAVSAEWAKAICARPCPGRVVRAGYFTCDSRRDRTSFIDCPNVYLNGETACDGSWVATTWCPRAAIDACREPCISDGGVTGWRSGHFSCGPTGTHAGVIHCPSASLPAEAICVGGEWQPTTGCAFPRPKCGAPPGHCCAESGGIGVADGPSPGGTCRDSEGYCRPCR